jgi:hypothetical protein
MDSGDYVGTSLIGVDRGSIAHLPGIVAVVTEGDFIGVVAQREEIAELAMHLLKVEWKPVPCSARWTIWQRRSAPIPARRAISRKRAMSMRP